MQICKDHWAMMREAIDNKGMSSLVAKDGKAAHENIVSELTVGLQPPFDPLMSMNWHWMAAAIECGGLAMMTPNDDGSPRCPICEYVKNVPSFDPKAKIDNVASQMQKHCIEEQLISKPS